MAWSIFTQGGGQGAAVTWAKDLLSALGVPQSQANVQFVYDWEVSEGGGGKYNPLNQGPVPGQPQLTTTGQQYGGGAADFASWQAGITGAVDYLHMPAYSGVLAGLKSGSYTQARSALIASPWAASHYGDGSAFSSATPPGAQPLSNIGGSVSGAGTDSLTSGIGGTLGGLLGGGFGSLVTDGINALLRMLGLGSLKDLFERLGLIILGFVLVIVGIHILASGSGKQAISITTTSDESGSTRKIKTPLSSHTKTVSKSAASTGAEEAVEAAAVA